MIKRLHGYVILKGKYYLPKLKDKYYEDQYTHNIN